MTDTQYRVLGALVAGGYLGPTGGVVHTDSGRRYIQHPTFAALLRAAWIAPIPSVPVCYVCTDAGRAAYAQAQARRAAQEATG